MEPKNDEIQDLLNSKNKTLFTTEDGLKKAIKVLGEGSTPHEAASAMSILSVGMPKWRKTNLHQCIIFIFIVHFNISFSNCQSL